MPFHWNNILVVTKEELVPAWYNSLSTLKSTISRYKDNKHFGVKRVQLGGNGRQMLISFDSLPAHIKEGLGDPRKCGHILERYYEIDSEAVSFFTTHKFDDNSYLSVDSQEKYITNASVLKAIIQLREDRQGQRISKGTKGEKQYKPNSIATTLCKDAISFQKTLHAKYQIQHTIPESEKRFKETIKDFEEIGYLSLISDRHRNQNSRKVTDKTISLLNNLFAGDKAKPSATEVHGRYAAFISGYITVINNVTGEIYDPKEFKSLSDATVKSYMVSWVNKIGTYQLRSSDRQRNMQMFKPYHSLDKPKFAGSLISIDDRQPPFKTPEGNRVWFYNAYDIASEVFTCCVYGDSKAGIITEFYKQLVRNYSDWGFNLPDGLEAEMSLNSSFVNTFLKPGAMFQNVRIEANNARGKFIERIYGKLRYQYEKKRMGWLARPNALSEKNQPAIEIEKVPTLPYETIIQNCLQDIQDWNNEPHTIHKDKSRWEVFCEMQHPDLKPTNYIALLPHLGRKTETSCNVGIIHLNGAEYLLGEDGKVSKGDNLIRLMQQVEGEQIDIHWMKDNDGNVLKALVFIDDQYICEAIIKPRYNRAKIEQTSQCLINREIMSAYVATIEAFGRKQIKAIEPVTIIDNRPAPKKTFVMRELKQFIDLSARSWVEPETLSTPTDIDFTPNLQTSFVRDISDRF